MQCSNSSGHVECQATAQVRASCTPAVRFQAVLRNCPITLTRAPTDIRGASRPAPIWRVPRGDRRSDGGLVVSRTAQRGWPGRQISEGRFEPARSRHSSANIPKRGQFVPDPIFAEHRTRAGAARNHLRHNRENPVDQGIHGIPDPVQGRRKRHGLWRAIATEPCPRSAEGLRPGYNHQRGPTFRL